MSSRFTCFLSAAALSAACSAHASPTTQIISVSSDGQLGNNRSFSVGLSADGRFALFSSEANNLVPNDANDRRDVFIHDLQNGTTERVSVDNNGEEFQGGGIIPASSIESAISGDGRFVLFCIEDEHQGFALKLRDRQQGTTSPITDNRCADFAISTDGSWIAYQLITQPNAVKLINRQDNTSTIISPPVADGYHVDIDNVRLSMDGSVLAFSAEIWGETRWDDFERIYAYTDGQLESLIELEHLSDMSLSGDGSTISFSSRASNLIEGFPEIEEQVAVLNRETREMDLITLDAIGMPANGWSTFPRISYDGNLVVFDTKATNLFDLPLPATTNVLLFDRTARNFELVNVSSEDFPANSRSYNPAISADGGVIGFRSYADNLVNNDTNGVQDSFVRIRSVAPVDPMKALNELLNSLSDEQMDPAIKNSLITSIESAQASLESDNATAATKKLHAFLLKVEAQRGKKIDSEAADLLSKIINNL